MNTNLICTEWIGAIVGLILLFFVPVVLIIESDEKF